MLSFFYRRAAGLAYCRGQIALVCMSRTFHTLAPKQLATAEAALQTETIQSLVTACGCRGWPAAIALPAADTFMGEMTLASCLTPRQRDLEIRAWLGDCLPEALAPEELFVNHCILSSDTTEITVLVVAAPVDTVKKAISMAEAGGLKVRMVDVDLLAEERGKSLLTQQRFTHLSHAAFGPLGTAAFNPPESAVPAALGLATGLANIWQ